MPDVLRPGVLHGLAVRVAGGGTAIRQRLAELGADVRDAPGGKVVLVAPGADAGEHAAAVGAALENLARTLSVEWARFGVRCTAIRPASAAEAADVAELVAFLASPAGDYYSGCAFTLA